jgi:hypothetical protein
VGSAGPADRDLFSQQPRRTQNSLRYPPRILARQSIPQHQAGIPILLPAALNTVPRGRRRSRPTPPAQGRHQGTVSWRSGTLNLADFPRYSSTTILRPIPGILHRSAVGSFCRVALPFDAIKKLLIIIVILPSALLARRALPAVSLEANNHGASPWRFRLAPCASLTSTSGTTGAGPLSTEARLDSSTILSKPQIGAMFVAEVGYASRPVHVLAALGRKVEADQVFAIYFGKSPEDGTIGAMSHRPSDLPR